MNRYPSGCDESRLREKQKEPCTGDDTVRNHQRRGWCVPPGLVDDRWSEPSDTDENHEEPSADVKAALDSATAPRLCGSSDDGRLCHTPSLQKHRAAALCSSARRRSLRAVPTVRPRWECPTNHPIEGTRGAEQRPGIPRAGPLLTTCVSIDNSQSDRISVCLLHCAACRHDVVSNAPMVCLRLCGVTSPITEDRDVDHCSSLPDT